MGFVLGFEKKVRVSEGQVVSCDDLGCGKEEVEGRGKEVWTYFRG